ncbi:MAG: sulfatase [Verrucomicrobiales bacterium]|nr:sulfatase [Verrucomicrobiales bacterium]
MIRQVLSLLPLLTVAILTTQTLPCAGADRPNIVLLIGDDIDRDTLGPWGGEAITPHLDQLAAEGVKFNRCYATVAMCAPFRQELYSGRTPWRTGAMPNHSQSSPDTKSLPHYLKPLGYRVALLGKGHVGPQQAYPFEKLGDIPKKGDANPIALERAGKYIAEAKEADEPFCLVVASHDGHAPFHTHGDPSAYDAAELTLPKDALDTPEYRHNLLGNLVEATHLDKLLGGLRKLIADNGLTEDTLVIFCSEQGNQFPFSKWTCFDGGLASGLVAAWPGVIPAGIESSPILWLSDIAPSLVEAAGGESNAGDFDGQSQWANFKGANEKVHDFSYGAFSNCNIIDNRERVFPVRSIRDERYTLIWCPKADVEVTSNVTLTQALQLLDGEEVKGELDPAASWVVKMRKEGRPFQKQLVERLHHRPEWALYDRESDPRELTNLVGNPEYAEVQEQLQGALEAWLERWGDSDPVKTETGFVKSKGRDKKK